jgi:hypothetical protein
VDGCGFHAVAELAWRAKPDMPLLPTVTDNGDSGRGRLTDWLLVNEAMRTYVIPDSYRVHIPPNGRPFASHHRLVTAAIDL